MGSKTEGKTGKTAIDHLSVLFDARMASWGGVGRYSAALLEALAELCREESLELAALCLSEDLPHLQQSIGEPARLIECRHHPWSPAGVLEAVRLARLLKPHVYHAPHIQFLPPGLGFATVGTLHDVIPLEFSRSMPSRLRRAAFAALVRDFTSRCDVVIFASRRASDSAGRHGIRPRRAVVIHHGVGQAFSPRTLEEQEKACSRYGITRQCITWLGPFRPHKNLELLLQAYALLPRDLRTKHGLALLGNCFTPYGGRIATMAKTLSLLVAPGRVYLPGPASEEDLPSLLSSASVFVLPSWTEGFGLPALEAAACGVPVLASATTPVREFLSNRVGCFEPSSPANLAQMIEATLRDKTQTRAVGPGTEILNSSPSTWSWLSVARKVAKVYRMAAPGHADAPAVL